MIGKMVFLLLVFGFLAACQTLPNYETGADCWRYGINDVNNTGRMTSVHPLDIKVVKMSYSELLDACGESDDGLSVLRACFQPRKVDGLNGGPVIYSLNSNWGKYNYFVAHERCHALLGRKHNACWNGNYENSTKDWSNCGGKAVAPEEKQ